MWAWPSDGDPEEDVQVQKLPEETSSSDLLCKHSARNRQQNLREVGLEESREERKWVFRPKPPRKRKVLEREGLRIQSEEGTICYSVSLED